MSFTRETGFISAFIIAFLSLLLITGLRAQEMLGVVNSNYTGINSALINPANLGSSKEYISVNVLAGDLFLNSNYFYVHRKDYGFFKIFRVDMNDPKYRYLYEYPAYDYTDTIHYIDFLKNNDQKNLYLNARLAGPSVMFHWGKHAISLVTGFRNNASFGKVPYNVANFTFRSLEFEPQHNITYDEGSFSYTALSWIELGLGYAYTLFKDSENEINAGITLKGLLGTGGAYASFKNINYMVPNRDSIYFNNMNATFGLALPMDYSTHQFPVFDPLIKGTGFSADVGINYLRSGGYSSGNVSSAGNQDGEEERYLFRIGLSLLDAGWITFNKSIQVHEFNDVNNALWPGLKNFHPSSIQQFFRSASYNLLGDSMASLTTRTNFSIYLPTAASLQFDYNVWYNVFVNATYVQGIPLGKPNVRRPSLIAITPRYETSLFEVNLPLSLSDFRHPAIGLALRIYNLVIGTEKLGTFLTLTDVKGLDVYFSLGFNISAKNENWKYKGSRSVPCESYQDYKRYQVK